MPVQVICPNCGLTQGRLDEEGRRTCQQCGQTLAEETGEAPVDDPGTSALDELPPDRARPTGAMTLLRNDLRSEEGNRPGGGWLDNILPRRPKIPDGQNPNAGDRDDRRHSGLSAVEKRVAAPPPPIPEATSPLPGPGVPEPPSVLPGLPTGRRPAMASGRRSAIVTALTLLAFAMVSLAALFEGEAVWANVLFLMTIALLGVAVLGVIFRGGEDRAFWQGFALFGVGYLVLAFGPLFPRPSRLELPTSALIRVAHAKAIGWFEVPTRSATAPTPFAPGDLPQFEVVGHCLFALTAGLLGSITARRFARSS